MRQTAPINLINRLIQAIFISLVSQVVTIYLLTRLIFNSSSIHFWFWILILGGNTLILLYVWIIRLYNPYKTLNTLMENYAFGYHDEVFQNNSILFSPAFGSFIDRIRKNTDTERALRNSNKHAEYLALQNQINPHFLYNTLEGIRSDALVEGNEHISQIVESLAIYFRYTISKTDQLVHLEDETSNIENYLRIQNYRFDNRIRLSFDFTSCDTEIRYALLPKLTLQPFIENAIIHGIEGKVEGGTILIRVRHSQNRLYVSVEDDGVGIPEKDLIRIQDGLHHLDNLSTGERSGTQQGGIAIRNVSNRIKLLFGERFGITLRSILGKGTVVEIVLPLVFQDRNRVEADAP